MKTAARAAAQSLGSLSDEMSTQDGQEVSEERQRPIHPIGDCQWRASDLDRDACASAFILAKAANVVHILSHVTEE